MFSEYEQLLLAQGAQLKAAVQPIILCGAGAFGRCALRAVQQLGKQVAAFCDNNAAVRGSHMHGVPVCSVEDGVGAYPNALFYVCVYNPSNTHDLEAQLRAAGANTVLRGDVLFLLYQQLCLKRAVPQKALIQTLYDIYESKTANRLYMVGVIITEKCTLRCTQCSHLIPSFEHPKHYDIQRTLDSIRALAGCVDVIEVLTLLGGESLLHPQLAQLCAQVSQIPNILRVHVLTNGTIPPEETLYRAFAGNITYLQINDYGELSAHISGIAAMCDNIGMEYDVYPQSGSWFPLEPPSDHRLSPVQCARRFTQCPLGRAYTEMLDGKFFLCGYAAAATALGLISTGEYVDMQDSASTMQQKALALEVLRGKDTLDACNFCGFCFDKQVPRALQPIVQEEL